MRYELYGICARTLCTPNCYVMTIFRPKDYVLLENGADCSCFFFLYLLSVQPPDLYFTSETPEYISFSPRPPIFCHFDDIFQHWKGIG